MKHLKITKDELLKWFDPVYDFEVDKEFLSFKTDVGYDSITEVDVSDEGVALPNGGNIGGGYFKECKIESAEDIYDALRTACDEEEGWECY